MPLAASLPSTRPGTAWQRAWNGRLAGLPLAEWYPDDPDLADALLVCATEVTTDEEIARFATALGEVLA